MRQRGSYTFNKNDEDLRGTGIHFQDALTLAFLRTGVARDQFEVVKWGKNQYGKSVPVEYRAAGGAEVSVDFAHEKNGPDAPHIGWQTPGKGTNQKSGHIIVDDVPSGRSNSKKDTGY